MVDGVPAVEVALPVRVVHDAVVDVLPQPLPHGAPLHRPGLRVPVQAAEVVAPLVLLPRVMEARAEAFWKKY